MNYMNILTIYSKSLIALCALLLLYVSGCSWSDPYSKPPPVSSGSSRPVSSGQSPQSTSAQKNLVVQNALRQIGVPYRYGGNNPNGFDCSGLVQFSHTQAGITVPRTTREQMNFFRTISKSELQTGDLAFFQTGNNQYHVALMINNTDFVHAPSSGKTVSTSNFSNPYWKAKFIRAARL
jgi:cell wall-associated NlpC family hydrolase